MYLGNGISHPWKTNGCVEALSSMRRDAEVAPECILRSLVTRKEMGINSLERALEAKERGKGKKGKRKEKGGRRESDHGGLDRHLIITERYP